MIYVRKADLSELPQKNKNDIFLLFSNQSNTCAISRQLYIRKQKRKKVPVLFHYNCVYTLAYMCTCYVGRDSLVGVATLYGLDGWVIEPAVQWVLVNSWRLIVPRLKKE